MAKIDVEKICGHKYETLSEYSSRGKNLLGQMVKAKMIKVQCSICSEKNIRFIEKL